MAHLEATFKSGIVQAYFVPDNEVDNVNRSISRLYEGITQEEKYAMLRFNDTYTYINLRRLDSLAIVKDNDEW